jgi:hypothetical protein
LNQWYHVALTVDTINNNTGTVYINNIAYTTNPFTPFQLTDLSNVKVLYYIPLPGAPASYMSDFRYYNRILTSTEVTALYQYTGITNNVPVINYNFSNPLQSTYSYLPNTGIPGWTMFKVSPSPVFNSCLL